MEFVRFHPIKIWERLAEASKRWKTSLAGNKHDGHGDANNDTNVMHREPTVFMAVPTIYAKVICRCGISNHLDLDQFIAQSSPS